MTTAEEPKVEEKREEPEKKVVGKCSSRLKGTSRTCARSGVNKLLMRFCHDSVFRPHGMSGFTRFSLLWNKGKGMKLGRYSNGELMHLLLFFSHQSYRYGEVV